MRDRVADLLTVNNTPIDSLHIWFMRHRQTSVRVAVVLAVMLGSFLIAPYASPLLLAVLLGTGTLLIFLRWPPLGLLTVIAALFIPFRGPSNANVTYVLVALLLGVWLLETLVRQRTIAFPDERPVRPLVAFVVVAGLALLIGQFPWYTFGQAAPLGAQVAGFSIFVLSAGAFLLTAYRVNDIRWLEWMTWGFLAIGSLYVIGRFVPELEQIIVRLDPNYGTGALFWNWLLALSVGQLVFNRRLPAWGKVLLVVFALATLYTAGVQNQDWKSGWIPGIVSVAVILGLRSWRLAPLIGVLGSGYLVAQGYLSSLLASDQYSLATRLDAWSIVLEIVRVNPILGLGPANYYWYTPLFRIRGYAVQFNSHNQYIDLIAQTGLLGLFCFLWFAWSLWWFAWALRLRVPDGFASGYVYAALGGLAGTLVAAMLGDWVLPFFYNVTLWGFRYSVLGWMFLGGLIAIHRLTSRPAQSDDR